MRKLMWFAIGFGIACGLCAYVLPDKWIIPLILGMIFLATASALVCRKWEIPYRAAAVCLGCAAGLCWFLAFQRFYLLPASALDGVEVNTTVTASDYSYETTYGVGVDGTVEVEGKRYQIRLYINEKKQIAPGDEITGTFRFRITTPDGQQEATYHQGKGIFLLGYQTDTVELSQTVKQELRYLPALLREKIEEILQICFPEDVFPFIKALLLGDSYDLSYEIDTAFKISGIRHIIAVSGLHVSILYGLISVLTGRKRFLTALLGLPVLLLFAAVAGFTPSVTRACIMVGLMILAMVFQREYDSPTALSFACLVMLIANPLVITSVSFQLSVGCVAGILMFHAPIHSWLKAFFPKRKGKGVRTGLQNWFTTSVSVTLSAMSITTPLSAYYFGTVSLIGVVTNLLTLWVVNFIFNGIIVVCLMSLISGSMAVFLAGILAWPVRYVLFVSKTLAALPLAAVYTRSAYIVAWLVFCYILLGAFLLSKRKRPGLLGCCAAIGLCLALLAGWVEPLLDDTRVTVLDVGQGQSILLQSEGRTYLVDCGGDSDETTADIVAETLLSQGISRLDGVILTHTDRDHAGALENLLTRMETDLLILPPQTEAPETDGKTVYASETVELTFGNAKLTIFGPIYSGSSNENSLCILFETEKCAILITGDRSDFGERMLLREAALPDIDLLIAGHHGSKNSTSEELLQAVRPEVVIISVGKDNPYGHPAEELLERLEAFGCAVFRTDENGTITFRR